MRLVIIDLTNGLLTNRDVTAARESAQEVLHALARRHRLTAFFDSDDSGERIRNSLEACGLAANFETVTTSCDINDELTQATVRYIAEAAGVATHHTAVVTNRPSVAEHLQSEGIVTLLAEWDRPLAELPESLAWVAALSSE